MPYLTDIAPLHYHAESVKLDDGTWIIDNVAEDFDMAVSVLQAKSEEYQAQRQQLREGNANTIDLTARAEHRPKGAKRSKQQKAA